MLELQCCTDPISYTGVVVCDPAVSLLVDVKITFEQDPVDDLCYAFLESICLGLTGIDRPKVLLNTDDCVDFDLEFEVVGGGGCEDPPVTPPGGCDALTISLHAEHLVKNPLAFDTTEQCSCGNCNCFTNRMDLVLEPVGGTECFGGQIVCFDPSIPGWRNTVTEFHREDEIGEPPVDPCDPDDPCDPSTITVLLRKNPGDDSICELVASSTGAVEGTGEPISLTGLCPDIFFVSLLSDGSSIIGTFQECSGAARSWCQGLPVPLTLTATFSNILDCAGVEGETVTLFWDGKDSWVGSGGDCTLFNISVKCSAADLWDFIIDSGCSRCPRTGAFSTDSCDPLELCVTITSTDSPCACCEVVGGAMRVCITE